MLETAVNLGRKALRKGGDVIGNGRRVVDDLIGNGRVAKRLDEYATRPARLADNVANTNVQRRLDEYATRSDDVVRKAEHQGASCGIGRNSFTEGTLVETDEGSVPIEEIEAGEFVLSEDPETGEQGYFEVVSVRSYPKDELVHVTIAVSDGETDGSTSDTTEIIESTPDHPVYVEEKGWMWAENLETGDQLRQADGNFVEVVIVEYEQLDEPELVYNFTVEGPHTYFVLETAVLVHNDSNICDPTAYPHLTDNLKQGGFTEEESHEIIRRLHDAGVDTEQLKLLDDIFANANEVNIDGFDLMANLDKDNASFLVWRFASEGHLYSNFSKLDSGDQQRLLRYQEHRLKTYPNHYEEGATSLEIFLEGTAPLHAMGDRKTSPWVATAGQLAPLIRTTDAGNPTRLFERTVTNSDTLYLLNIPEHKLNFGSINVTSETEILANAMNEPLNKHVVISLPNIFRDKDFSRRLRQSSSGK